MERHLLDVREAQPPKSPDLFDHDTVVAARSLLDDDFSPAHQEGYISSGEVTRQIEPDVWEAMRALRASERRRRQCQTPTWRRPAESSRMPKR